MLRKTFAHYDASVVAAEPDPDARRSSTGAEGFGSEPTKYRYDVIFLKPPLTAKTVVAERADRRKGVDRDLGRHRRRLLLEADEPGDVEPL